MPEFLVPQWDLPAGVRALQTTRCGGLSQGPWSDFNLGDHVGDAEAAVASNRALLRAALPAAPHWLRQVHGALAVDAASAPELPEADAIVARRAGQVCAVLTADCLPVLLCDERASVVGAAHAGWRGLLAGVLENTVTAMASVPASVRVWLGPAIGPQRFEVGPEVRAAFVAHDQAALAAFSPGQGGRWWCDIYALARQRLHAAGVLHISGGGECTVADSRRYYSYRRDGVTGRMASLIWLEAGTGGV